MRAVISRVQRAAVRVDDQIVGQIHHGLLVYVGVMGGDTMDDVVWLSGKLPSLRVFTDEQGKMNRSVIDIGGSMLLVPNFTLAGRTSKGTRPSYSEAAPPAEATALFEALVQRVGTMVPTATGKFGAHMLIDQIADGPVTLIMDSRG